MRNEKNGQMAKWSNSQKSFNDMKKTFKLLVLCAVAVFAVAGCGGNGANIKQQQAQADSLLNVAYRANEYKRLETLSDKLYFCVGDVSGKGVPASLFMAQATRLFLTLAKQAMSPAEICTRMNDALSGDNESNMFVTFWLGLVDLTTGHLTFCNAGHNPPVIREKAIVKSEQFAAAVPSGEGYQFLEMIPNAPIGILPGMEYRDEEVETIKGRPLFIYTDGLNEAENKEKELFGDERLLDILRNTPFTSARQVIEKLRAEVEAHRNGAEPNDDLTMMCLHIPL